jgi:hypothetical protein
VESKSNVYNTTPFFSFLNPCIQHKSGGDIQRRQIQFMGNDIQDDCIHFLPILNMRSISLIKTASGRAVL